MAQFRNHVKYLLFLSSYVPLYIIIAIRIHNEGPLTNIGGEILPFSVSWPSLILVGLSILLGLLLYGLIWVIRGRGTKTKRVEKTRLHNELLATHLLVYVFVFGGLSFTNVSDIVIFILFFGLMFAIQIRSEILYTNPLLALGGYRIYEVTLSERVVLVISKNPLEEKLIRKEEGGEMYEEIKVIPMGSNTFITPKNVQ